MLFSILCSAHHCRIDYRIDFYFLFLFNNIIKDDNHSSKMVSVNVEMLKTMLILQLVIIGRAKRAPHWGVQSRFRMIYVVGMSEYVCRMSN